MKTRKFKKYLFKYLDQYKFVGDWEINLAVSDYIFEYNQNNKIYFSDLTDAYYFTNLYIKKNFKKFVNMAKNNDFEFTLI